MFRLVSIILTLTLVCSTVRADGGADLSTDTQAIKRSIKVKEIAGGTLLALGIPALVAGVALAGDGFVRSFCGFESCTDAEKRAIDGRLLGAGLGLGLGVAAVVSGAITLSVAGQQRKALKYLTLSVAPSVGGASGMVRLSF
jgi:hypothetical protein